MKKEILLLLFIPLMLWWSCEELAELEDCAGVIGGDNICGCTDSTATNYDSNATFNDESCEYDTTPPNIVITTSFTGTVSEIVTISVMVTDDAGIEKVELWVDGVNTNIIDDTEPFELLWNTATYDDSTDHVIVARVYDTSGNTADSDPVTLIIDNSLAVPAPVQLYPVTFQDNTFFISWSQNDDDDFLSYNLYESIGEETSAMELVFSTNTRDDTTFTVTGISSDEERYYQVIVSDSLGLTSNSNIQSGTNTILWSNVYDHNNLSDWGNSIIEVSDGYWALGVASYGIRLMKTDLEGNLIADHLFGYGYGNQILEADDGFLYIIGGGDSGYNGSQILVIKTDIEGTEIWRKYLGEDSWGYGGLFGQDGDIIIYGEENGHGAVYTLSKDDTTDYAMVASDENMDRVKGMVESETEGGGYYIAFSKDYETKIIKTDNNFSEVSDITISGYCRSISSASDGNLLITLQIDENEHKVAKLEPSTGQDLWAETATGLYNSFQFGSNYYAIGHNDNGSLFLKLDEGGSIITSITFGSGILSSYALTSDGGIIITGTTSYWNDEQSDTPLYKTNRNGELGETFNLIQGSGQLLSMVNNRDSNLIPVQISKK